MFYLGARVSLRGWGRGGNSKDAEFTYLDSPIFWDFEERRTSSRRRMASTFCNSKSYDMFVQHQGRKGRYMFQCL